MKTSQTAKLSCSYFKIVFLQIESDTFGCSWTMTKHTKAWNRVAIKLLSQNDDENEKCTEIGNWPTTICTRMHNETRTFTCSCSQLLPRQVIFCRRQKIDGNGCVKRFVLITLEKVCKCWRSRTVRGKRKTWQKQFRTKSRRTVLNVKSWMVKQKKEKPQPIRRLVSIPSSAAVANEQTENVMNFLCRTWEIWSNGFWMSASEKRWF